MKKPALWTSLDLKNRDLPDDDFVNILPQSIKGNKMKTTSILEKFFELYLANPEISNHAVISGMGLATMKVHDNFFIGYLREYFQDKEIEAEFSFFRNKFLHFSPTKNEDVSFGSGSLHIRVGGDIFHFCVMPIGDNVVVKCAEEFTDDPTSGSFHIDELDSMPGIKKTKEFMDYLQKQIEFSLKERYVAAY